MSRLKGASVGLVQKQVFETSNFTTVSGRVLKSVRLGYESYGQLNAARDNVILIAHYFTGTSHCAGRYAEADLEPGYWDSVIGPGRAFDTDRFFIVSMDTFCNLNTGDARVATTGPASLDPDTGKPYGMNFPLLTIRDFVAAQRKLLDHLGVQRLFAAAGPSMGSLQAFEWAASYPNDVDRIVAVIPGALETDPYLIATLYSWMSPILADPDWQNGDYYGAKPPERGLTEALKLVTLNALHYEWARRVFGRRPQEASLDPAHAFQHQFAIEAGLDEIARTRAKIADANSFLYLAKAVQLFSIKDHVQKIRAKALLIDAQSDLLMFPDYAKQAATELREAGVQVETDSLRGGGGHLEGLHAIAEADATLRRFLS